MANLDQIQLNGSGNYSELLISEPPPPYIPGTSASYANNTTVTGNSGTQFHVTEVSSGSQSAVAPEQKVTNLNSASHSNQTTTYVVSHNTQPNSYDINSTNDDSLRNAPSLFIDLQGLDEKPQSGGSPIRSNPLEIPIQNPVIANLKASGTTYPPPVINAPVANSPPQQSFMNLNQTSSQHNSRTATPINSGTPINTPPTSLTAPLQKATLMQQAANTSPVQMQPAPLTINMEQLQNNLQALGISPAQNGQWTMNPNAQLTTFLSALGQQQQNVPLANVTAAQLTGQQVNPSLAVAPQTLQVAPQQMVASNGVGLMPSTSSTQVVQTPHTSATVQQMQQAVQAQQVQQIQQAMQAQQQQQLAQVPQVQQVQQVQQHQHVVPQVPQTQQVQQAQQQQQQVQHIQQLAQVPQGAQLTQNQVQQPPNGMAVLQQDGSIMTPAYGASIMNSGTGQMQQFNPMQLNSNQIPQLAMYATNPVQQNVNVAALEHQLQADTLTLMMQMMKTMGELNKRMASLENEVDGLRQQVRQQQQQNMQLQQTLMTVQQHQPLSGAQNPNGQEDKSRANRTNGVTASNSNQILSLNEAPPVNSMGTNPRPGVVNAQYYQTPQNPYFYTTTNNGMQYVQPMATTQVPMPVPVGSQVPGYPGQVYYYTTAQQPTAVQGQQRFVYTNPRQ